MRHVSVLFDFDGTLADSQALALRVINELAPEFGFEPVDPAEVSMLKRVSARQLLKDRMGIRPWELFKIRRLEQRVREKFREHANELHVFQDVPKMMHELQSAGYEIGVVSSNEHEIVGDVLERGNVNVNFVHGGSAFFGKAQAIRGALKEYGINAKGVVYVGDELRDVEACKKVGIDMVAVGWGLNDPDSLRAAGARVAATPHELLCILVDAT